MENHERIEKSVLIIGERGAMAKTEQTVEPQESRPTESFCCWSSAVCSLFWKTIISNFYWSCCDSKILEIMLLFQRSDFEWFLTANIAVGRDRSRVPRIMRKASWPPAQRCDCALFLINPPRVFAVTVSKFSIV